MAETRLTQRDYTYELSDAERDRLTKEFLAIKAPPRNRRFVCYEVDGTDPYSNIARQIEREVFFESWGNDAQTMQHEFGPYEESSLFFLAIDTQAEVPAGVVRMIRNSPAGLKTIVDLDDCVKSPISPMAIPAANVKAYHGIDDLDRCWDGATAAVPRRYRRKLLSIHIEVILIMVAAAMREDIRHFVSVLDAPVVKTARDVLGLPLVALVGTPPFTHMDAPNNQAVYAHVPTLLSGAVEGNRRVAQKIRDCVAQRSRSSEFETPPSRLKS